MSAFPSKRTLSGEIKIFILNHEKISGVTISPYLRMCSCWSVRCGSIEPNFQNRLGASLVGWHASWWMGLIIGIPVYFAALFVRGNRLAIKVFLKAAMIVVILTLLLGVIALVIGYFSISDTTLPSWMNGKNITNPVAFSRAGNMHNFSYLGGLVGLLSGLIFTIISAWKSRQREPITKIQ